MKKLLVAPFLLLSNCSLLTGAFSPECGDGFVQDGLLAGDNPEECDDGNAVDSDSCPRSCKNAVCGDAFVFDRNGDGVVDPQDEDESCDDGNIADNDGCDSDCSITALIGVETGGEHTCAVFHSGDVKCWGKNEFSQLGIQNTRYIGDDEDIRDFPLVDLGGANIEQLALGGFHSCALTTTGEVLCWGRALEGQLGYGNTDTIGDDEAPGSAGFVNLSGQTATQIVAGEFHTCALLQSGDVSCWGANGFGQLGNGDAASVGAFGDNPNEKPSDRIVALGLKATKLAAGSFHTCAILQDDTLKCWGSNGFGQLGNGNSSGPNANIGDDEATIPVVPLSNVTSIIAGQAHTCAIANNSLHCWGFNAAGVLGLGLGAQPNEVNIGDDEPIGNQPVLATNPGETIKQITGGTFHTCALLSSGDVRCWGSQTLGETGAFSVEPFGDNPGEEPRLQPFVELGAKAVQISSQKSSNCAVLETGKVQCWGRNLFGGLGYNGANTIIGDDETLDTVSPIDLGFTPQFIESNELHTCAFDVSGQAKCWGMNTVGILGTGSAPVLFDDFLLGDQETVASLSPVDLVLEVAQLSTGVRHNCALFTNGNLNCWGLNVFGELGRGINSGSNIVIGDTETPAGAGNLNVIDTVVNHVSLGNAFTCILADRNSGAGQVICWGLNNLGQLGVGNTINRGANTGESPAQLSAVSLVAAATQISVGFAHTCALLDNNNLRCWGSNSNGQLGLGDNTNALQNIGDNESPNSQPPINLGTTDLIKQVSAGRNHTCVLFDSGKMMCWGDGSSGALGYGDRTSIGDNETPAAKGFFDAGGVATQIATGNEVTCARFDNGDVKCWGFGGGGTLGQGNTTQNLGDDPNELPANLPAINLGESATQISLRIETACAILQSGDVKCWGTQLVGEHGTGDFNYSIGDNETPAQAGDVHVF